jgi:hypothetical protein
LVVLHVVVNQSFADVCLDCDHEDKHTEVRTKEF